MIALSYLDAFIDFKVLKKGFLGLSIAMALFIPLDLWLLHFGQRGGQGDGVAAPALASRSLFETRDAYESSLQKSTVFGLASPEGNLSVLKSSIAELMKDYRLKGVMIAGEPQAILEDARTQKSVFVRTGDQVGELTVKAIKEDTVIMSYYSEEKEMRI